MPAPNVGAPVPSSMDSITKETPKIKWHFGEDKKPNHSPENGQFTLRRRTKKIKDVFVGEQTRFNQNIAPPFKSLRDRQPVRSVYAVPPLHEN